MVYNKHLLFIKKIKNDKLYKNIKKIKLKIGTDCSGIEAPIVALNLLGIKYSHEFSCDNDKYAKETIMHNYNPKIFYDNIFGRDHSKLPDIAKPAIIQPPIIKYLHLSNTPTLSVKPFFIDLISIINFCSDK